MTYSLGGVPFDNPTYGWVLRGSSAPLADLSATLTALRAQGRHGVISTVPGVMESPLIRLVVQTPRAQLRTLEAFARAGGVLTSVYDVGGATVEFVSLSPTGYGDGDALVDVAIVFRVPDAAARGSLVTSDAVSVAAASVQVPGLFPGLGLEVQDALVRVRGAVEGLVVTDSGGSWFSYDGTLTTSQRLRFESDSGRAFLTTSDTWTGGTEVSGSIDYGGPRGIFEISPSWSSDPSARAGVLTITSTSRSGAVVQVRGRAAHLI